MNTLGPAIRKLTSSYSKETPTALKIIDAYLIYILLSGVSQFAYMVLAGTYPYNAFLSGFASTVGSFVLAANLRIQSNTENSADFKAISPEQAFADFVVCSILLHLFVVNFIG